MLLGRYQIGAAYVGSSRGRVYASGAAEAGAAGDASAAGGSSGVSVAERATGIGTAILGNGPLGRYNVGGPAVGAADRVSIASVYGLSTSEAGSASDSSAAGAYGAFSANDALSATYASVSILSVLAAALESGSALDGLTSVAALSILAQDYGAAIDYPDATALKPVSVVDRPSGLGSGAIGAAYLGATALGGGPVGIREAAIAGGSIGGVQAIVETLAANDAFAGSLTARAAVSERPVVHPSAIGLSVVGGQALGGGSRIGPISVYVPVAMTRDSANGGIPKFGALVDSPTSVAVPGLSARPILGGYAVGAAPIGGKGVPVVAYSLGASDTSSWSYLYTRSLADTLLALDAAYGFVGAPGAVADVVSALDKSSVTILAAVLEIGYASDASDAIDFPLFAVRLATYASGITLATTQSGSIVLSRGSGEVITTVGSGLALTTKGSGAALATSQSGAFFVGSEIMAATLNNQPFYVGEHWPILGTATDYQGRALDLTGATIRFRLVDANGADVMDLAVGTGISILSPASSGQYLILVSPANQISSKIVPGVYGLEVRITTGSGIVTTQLVGTIKVLGSEFF